MIRKKIALRGVPCGLGAGQWGSSFGPEDLLKRGLERLYSDMGYEVDTTLLQGPSLQEDLFQSGFHHKEAVLSWCRQLQKETQLCLRKDYLPILIGGDHSISMGSISGVAQYCQAHNHSLTVVWLDAHGDFNTSQTSQTGHIHGMPLASLCGYGDLDFVSMIGQSGLLDPQDVHLLGVRDLDDQEQLLLTSTGVTTYSMGTLGSLGYSEVMQRILEQASLRPSPYVHLSFDLDFMDASLAQGTGTPVGGGPTLGEVSALFRVMRDSGLLCSMDIVEYNPLLKGASHTAEALFDLLQILFEHP